MVLVQFSILPIARASLFHGTDRTGPDPDPNPQNGPEWRGTHVRRSRPRSQVCSHSNNAHSVLKPTLALMYPKC